MQADIYTFSTTLTICHVHAWDHGQSGLISQVALYHRRPYITGDLKIKALLCTQPSTLGLYGMG